MTSLDSVGKVFDRRIQKGLHYVAFLRQLADAMGCKSYFEIGVGSGKSFRGIKCNSVGVDPKFKISESVVGEKPALHLFEVTSDAFFKETDLFAYLPGGFDLAFLDGMHRFEYVLRDFYNTERYAHAGSIILLHDCLPINAEMAERRPRPERRVDKEYQSHWTGDVWKLVPILRTFRPDLQVDCVNCRPTGLVAVSKLDPTSTVLAEKYEEIVSEYMGVELTGENFRHVHESARTRESVEFLASFARSRAG